MPLLSSHHYTTRDPEGPESRRNSVYGVVVDSKSDLIMVIMVVSCQDSLR